MKVELLAEQVCEILDLKKWEVWKSKEAERINYNW